MNEDKKAFLRKNGWTEVLEDCWIDNDRIKVSNPHIDYYWASTSTEQAYNREIEAQKKSIVEFNGVTYLLTTDPIEVGNWVHIPNGMLQYESVDVVTEENIEAFISLNAKRIISCTNNDGMKHVGYLIIEKP